jgi:hypothetical protein
MLLPSQNHRQPILLIVRHENAEWQDPCFSRERMPRYLGVWRFQFFGGGPRLTAILQLKDSRRDRRYNRKEFGEFGEVDTGLA